MNCEKKNYVVFGQYDEQKTYTNRTGAYVIPFNDEGRIGLCECPDGYFLLGGGVEDGENLLTTVTRECLEEVGAEVEILGEIGRSDLFYYSTKYHTDMQNEQYFYLGKLLEADDAKSVEDDHKLIWLEPNVAMQKLFLENQAWAVQQAVLLNRQG